MNIPPATPEAEIVNRRKQKRLIEIFSPLRNHPSIPSTAYKKRTLSAIKEVPTPAADTGSENHVSFNQGGDNIDADDDDAFAYGLVNTSKIFNDHVHANIKLEGLCLRIIDTPEFQRLHGLKQNGTTDFVFRGATHTRFEHSLGVAHLAERFVKTLQRNQPGLGITETDVLCVKIAGLCHDLGHGPFSHLYDGVFLKRMYPDGIDASRKKWRHEDGSIRMLRHLLIKNDIDVTEYGLNLPTAAAAAEPEAEVDEVDGSNSNSARKRRVKTHTASSPPTATSSVPAVSATIPVATTAGALHQYNDMTFIEEIINGTDEARRVGRGKDKFYLYDIVNNLRSGLDVDKLDYFQRDMKMSNVFPMPVVTFDRFIELGLVLPATPIGSAPGLTGNEIPEELPKMICYPEKMASEALNLFAARFHMHQKVYQHKAVKQVEYMITEALVLANPYIDIKGTITTHHPKGLYKISECIYDMNAMCNLKDSVIDIIMHSADPRLQPAQHIITRILCRDLYSCVGDASYSLDNGMGRYINAQSEEEIGAEIVRISENLERYGSSHVVSGRTNISSSSGGSSSDFVLSHGTTTTGVGFSVKSLLMDGTESEGDEEGGEEGEGGIDDRSGKGEDEQGAQAKRQKLDNETSAEGSTNPLSQSQSQSQSQRSSLPLLLEDFIVEKMHIHYGCRALNPVTNLRFYTKTIRRDGRPLGRAVNVDQMVAAPRDFEVFKLRMFCKIPNPHKEALIRQCFELYCAEHNASAPFPSSSQG